jgi:hypothetical protein
MSGDPKNTKWSEAKGIANEATLNRFIETVGGKRFDSIVPSAPFENADYYFPEHKIIAELKILEKEFYKTTEFQERVTALLVRHVKEKGMRGPLLGERYPEEFIREFNDLFRPPLANIARKANRQIRSTKEYLKIPNANGVLLCVNDNLRGLPPMAIMQLFGQILSVRYSSITAMVYLTNHYIDVPGNNYANLLWAPQYSENAPDSLVKWVNSMGREWGLFIERETGPFDNKVETDNDSILTGSKAIRND